MRNFILFTILTMSSALYANDIITLTTTPLAITQEEGEPGTTDAQGRKQGFWVIFGKDKPEKGYPDAGKIEEGPYKDDRKNGQWTMYHKDGTTPRLIGEFSNGRPKGAFTKFHGNGKEKTKGIYVNGKHQGSLESFYKDGTPSQVKNFNTEGKEEGKQVLYYPNGQVEVEYETKNGTKTGKQIRYYENGDVKQVIEYNPDGTVKSKVDSEPTEPVVEVEVDAGSGVSGAATKGKVKNGEFKPNDYNKVYNSDDELWMDGKFKNGKLWDGKLYKYDSDGILLKIEIWKNGKYHSDGIL